MKIGNLSEVASNQKISPKMPNNKKNKRNKQTAGKVCDVPYCVRKETPTRKGLGTWKGGDREERGQRGWGGEDSRERTAGTGRAEGTEGTEGTGVEVEGVEKG